MKSFAWAQEEAEGEPEGFELIVGPRVGVAYSLMTPEEYTEYVHKLFPEGDYYPITAVFGVTVEQRILLGQTRSHFAFQELILVNGLEQSIALPMGALFIGYRTNRGSRSVWGLCSPSLGSAWRGLSDGRLPFEGSMSRLISTSSCRAPSALQPSG